MFLKLSGNDTGGETTDKPESDLDTSLYLVFQRWKVPLLKTGPGTTSLCWETLTPPGLCFLEEPKEPNG